LPISLAAWFLGLGALLTLAFVCTIVWAGADLLAGHAYSSYFYLAWNSLIRLVCFFVIGGSVHEIRYLLDNEQRITEALRKARGELEQRVQERTTELHLTVIKLQEEVIERREAEEALKGSEEKLRYLAEQLLTAQEKERKYLAAELHDELGHALLALKLHLSDIEKKMKPQQEELKKEFRTQINYVNEVIQNIRRLYHDLSPGDLEDIGLTKALRTLINDFAGLFPQITWQVDIADLDGLLSLPVQTTIYRIVQEALTNIGKHADPTAVTISSKRNYHQVHFIIQDNGTGFDAVQELGSRRSGRGLGLVAMEERLNIIGGSFEIHSRQGEGTMLSFTIPTLPEGEQT
jgi:signal transduction histidine kinase